LKKHDYSYIAAESFFAELEEDVEDEDELEKDDEDSDSYNFTAFQQIVLPPIIDNLIGRYR